MPSMKLAPCHALFQFYVADGELSCRLQLNSDGISSDKMQMFNGDSIWPMAIATLNRSRKEGVGR